MKRHPGELLLHVNPVLCDGYGHCFELAPDLVELDEWGYPIVRSDPFPASETELVQSARLAVRGCPRQAMWLERQSRRH